MDLTHKIAYLELREAYFDRSIDSIDSLLRAACSQITELQKEVDALTDKVNKQHAELLDLTHSNRERIQMTAEKAYHAFYKLFPEVGKAEDVLDRIVREQKKDSRDES